MMKLKALCITMACICAVLAVALLLSMAQDKEPVRPNFVPSPEFSPPYPPLPHHFGKTYGIQILCQAPKGAIKRALAQPLEPVSRVPTCSNSHKESR